MQSARRARPPRPRASTNQHRAKDSRNMHTIPLRRLRILLPCTPHLGETRILRIAEASCRPCIMLRSHAPQPNPTLCPLVRGPSFPRCRVVQSQAVIILPAARFGLLRADPRPFAYRVEGRGMQRPVRSSHRTFCSSPQRACARLHLDPLPVRWRLLRLEPLEDRTLLEGSAWDSWHHPTRISPGPKPT